MELPGGGGDCRAGREVLALSKGNNPKLVFVCETRQEATKIEKMKWRLGLKGFHGVSSDGRSGGLALFWDENLTVMVLESCSRFIDVRILEGGSSISWRDTFVYGEPRVENLQWMWDHLCRLRAVSREPWVVCGDFNEALWQYEHLSRSARAEAQMSVFRDCLQTCDLEELGFSGLPFTYNNGQDENRNVQVRLDRACVDEAL